MENNTVTFEKVGRTALITLNRPQRKNAIDEAMQNELSEALDAARKDPSVTSVVLTGAGGDFCSGADLQRTKPDVDDKAFAAREGMLDHHRWLSRLVDLEKPVIAAVDGVAAGAGFSLALAADIVIATPRVRFLSAFLRVGLVPDLSLLHALPRVVGLARAKEIVFSAREIRAEEALSLGLALGVVPAEGLREAALQYAQSFDHAPTQALGLAKSMLNRSFETDRHTLWQMEAAAQALCASSSYSAEAVRRFRVKEAPMFSGAPALTGKP